MSPQDRSHSAGRNDAPEAAPELPLPGEAIRNVAGDPLHESLINTSASPENQWSLIWREFRKRKLALVAAWMLLGLITLCIFAPLLANDRPIAYLGANRYQYANDWRTARVQLNAAHADHETINRSLNAAASLADDITSLPPSVSADLRAAAKSSTTKTFIDSALLDDARQKISDAAAEARRSDLRYRRLNTEVAKAGEASSHYVRVQETMPGILKRMHDVVGPESAKVIAEIQQQFASSVVDRIDDEELSRLRKTLNSVREDEVGFISRWHFPSLATLRGPAIAFMVLNLLFVMFLFIWLVYPGGLPASLRSLFAYSLLAIPLVAGGLWQFAVEAQFDKTVYKAGLPVNDSNSASAPVLYQQVIWPPIRYGYDEINLDRKYLAPAFISQPSPPAVRANDVTSASDEAASGTHLFGTDKIGRDVMSRMLWGGRISLSVGLVSVAIYVGIGIVVGALAGFYRGWVDMLISRIIEVVIVFPTFFLILTIVAFVGPSLWNIMVVIGLTGWTGVARLVRGEFLRLADQEFVLAGRSLGFSSGRLIFRHILPNAIAPVLVAATFGIAGAILTESALSFLGLGITVPTPSWGSILAEGRTTTTAPWLIYFPGLAIFLTIMSYNLAGEALRDASDPRLRGGRA